MTGDSGLLTCGLVAVSLFRWIDAQLAVSWVLEQVEAGQIFRRVVRQMEVEAAVVVYRPAV